MSENIKKELSKNIFFMLFVVPIITLLVTEAAAAVRDKPLADHVQLQHTKMLEAILNQQGSIVTNQAVIKTDLDNLRTEVNILRGIK